MSLPPSEIVIRPPVEAYSILIGVTGGCSWNRCRFCGAYKGIQDFAIRPIEDVKKDIDLYSSLYPKHKWVFLAGGNLTCVDTDYLVEIIKHVKSKFKNVERISCYSKALDIVKKSDEELKKLAEAGLTIVYMGLESGSNVILKYMRKGTNDKTIINVCKRLMNAGIKVSLYVILGIGSYKWSEIHIKETARVLTEINPTIFRFRTLNVLPNAPLWKDVQKGEFEIMKPVDILRELKGIIENLGDNVTSEVYNDHISNYTTLSSKNIKKDRDRFIKDLEKLIIDPRIQNLPPKRLLYM
ncbi:MAG: radical SAM protein [Promethearchaeota archaeon]